MNRDGANGGGGENLRVRKPPAQGDIREEEQLHRHLHWLPQRALRCTNSHILIIIFTRVESEREIASLHNKTYLRR